MRNSEVKCSLINGEWVKGPAERENINPSNTNDIVGVYTQASVDQAEDAVEAAYGALSSWRHTSPQVRADILDHVGTALLARKNEIGELLAREEGKTLPEAIGETARAGQIFKFFAQEALRLTGDMLESVRPGIDVEVIREPVGVVGLITPWNFPIAIPAWKVAPALAFGNTVVMKPADLTPACAHVLAELLMEAGCPAGVFNLVCGPGRTVGQAIVDHPKTNAVSFTGSVGVGRGLAESAIAGMKKIQLEMGGKNPTIVMNDADLDVAVESCVNSAFFSTGQRCTASSRLIVQSGIHDAFVDRLTARVKGLTVGDALDPKTNIGPVVSEHQLRNNLSYVDLAKEEGADVIGGVRLEGVNPGYYQAPALFLNASNEMRSSREEIFGPCASVIRVEDFDEVVTVANDTEFGLSSAICTTSLKYAREFKRRSEAGMVMINLPTAGVDYHVPFGGRKGSSYGSREQGRYAAEFYTSLKTAYIL